MSTMNEPVAFIIEQADVPGLLKAMGLQCNEGSDLYRAEAGLTSDTDIKSTYGEFLADENFLQACRIIARPDLYVTARASGASGFSESRLHRKKDEGDRVALTEAAEDEGILITLFPDYGVYLDGLTENLAIPVETPAANYIPPTVSLEEFLFILHAVDSFRRVTYRNMLDHVFTSRAHITILEFAQSMGDALNALDIRWLLPNFMAVTPGVQEYKSNLDPENLAVLLTHNFFESGKLHSGEDVLVFGEAAQVMGVEFLQSWLQSYGFEIKLSGPNGFQTLERLFIAPTVLTNHLVRLAGTQGGKAVVNHQAYTGEHLLIKLDEIFDAAFSAEPSELPPVEPAAVPSAPKRPAASPASKAAATPSA